jgi:hypothetical protein
MWCCPKCRSWILPGNRPAGTQECLGALQTPFTKVSMLCFYELSSLKECMQKSFAGMESLAFGSVLIPYPSSTLYVCT